MNRYTVLWDHALEASFIDMWTKSDSQTRDALTAVASWIDRNLAVDPDTKGRPEPDSNERVTYVPHPLARVSVRFQVFAEDNTVRVTRITFRSRT
jgi:hypothetical protein